MFLISSSDNEGMATGEESGATARAEMLKLHQADMGAAEEQELIAALRSGWLTKGPRTREFEQRFAARVQSPDALGVNSCTAALHLALLAAEVGPGAEVIVPALTFASSANVVVHTGATPVFADVLAPTHTIDPEHVARLITKRTKALIPVHFGGIPCEMDALGELARQHNLVVIEDCAHAIEAEYRNQPVGVAGGVARFAAYSFYATKNLITGEGGMLCCRDLADHQRAAVLGLHGMSADAWRRYQRDDFRLYDIVAAGFKYNMFDLQAALGLVQLQKLDENWAKRQACVAYYDELLAAVEGATPLCYPDYVKPAHHLYLVKLDAELADRAARETQAGSKAAPHASPLRDAVIRGLRQRQVEAYVHYICLPETEFYRQQFGTAASDAPVAADLSRRSVTLPLFPTMGEAEVEYVVGALKDTLAEAAR